MTKRKRRRRKNKKKQKRPTALAATSTDDQTSTQKSEASTTMMTRTERAAKYVPPRLSPDAVANWLVLVELLQALLEMDPPM